MANAGRANIRQVAGHAGVAVSSVSRVLTDHPDVSLEMRERVMASVAELGYHPNMLAQGLRNRRTMTVGFVVGDISNPILADVMMGAETALREAGYSVILINSENQPELDARHIDLLQRRRVDGMLLTLASEDDEDTLAALRGLEQPIVLLDREVPASEGLVASAVLHDHASGMAAAGTHLLDLGHRSIGLIVGRPLRFTRERHHGLARAYAQRGLKPTYRMLEGHLDAEHGQRAAAELLDGGAEPITAIIAGGNQLLAGVLAEFQRRGIEPGREVSLVSCDEIPLTELFQPPIAVVRRDTREFGRRAAELLLEALEDDTRRTVVLPTEFVPRPSCTPLAAS
jgi:LacI family transcriptional regulator